MKESINTFSGKMVSDLDLRVVEKGDYIHAFGIRNGFGSVLGGASPAQGNEEVEYEDLEEDAANIGTVGDELGQSVINFNYNDEVTRYFTSGTIERVLKTDFFNFIANRHNHGVVVDKNLVFTDGHTVGNDIQGNQPRYIDLNLAKKGKGLTYELIWDASAWEPGNPVTLVTTELDGTTLTNYGVIYTTNSDPIPDQVQALVNILINDWSFQAEACHNKLKVTSSIDQRMILTLADTHFILTNFYPLTLIQSWINLYRRSPRRYPEPRYAVNTEITSAKIWAETFQFRYQYIYYDGQESVWSPISYAPTNLFFLFLGNDKSYTEIIIKFNDEILDSADWKTFVRKIRLAVRYGETGIFREVETIDVADLGINLHEYTFRNDRIMNAVPSDDDADEGVQALKNQESIPLIANTVTSVSTPEGNTLLVLGGLKEALNMPDCPLITAEVFSDLTRGETPASFTPNDQYTMKSFKGQGVYDVSIIGEDLEGRQTPVIDADARIVFEIAREAAQNWQGFQVTIDGIVPAGWKFMRVVMTKNQKHATWYQLIAYAVFYYKFDSTGGLINTTYAAGDAIYVGFHFFFDAEAPSAGNIFFDLNLAQDTFLVETGDRISIIYDSTGANTDYEEYDYPVAGYKLPVSPTNKYIVYVPFDPDQPSFEDLVVGGGDYVVADLYRPRTVQDEIFYEISDAIEVESGNTFPSVDINLKGDTYFKKRDYNSHNETFGTFAVAPIERATLYDFDDTKGGDWGRPHVKDPLYGLSLPTQRFRNSDFYISGSNVNGLHSFRGAEYQDLDIENGPIQKMVFKDVLFAACRNRCQTIYVKKGQILSTDGDTTLTLSSRLFTVAPPFMEWWGTQNVESVYSDRYIWGWDKAKGVVWRYANGLEAISFQGQNTFFRTKAAERREITNPLNDKTIISYQRQFNTVYITFNEAATRDGVSPALTMAYEEGAGWKTEMPFTPEMYGSVGDHFISFKDARLFLHERGDYMVFYDTQYFPSITFIVNELPRVIKYPQRTKVHSDHVWEMPTIIIPPTDEFPVGQETRLKYNHFKNYEGLWNASFKRDILDNKAEFVEIDDASLRETTALLRGRVIRGEIFKITLKKKFPNTFDTVRAVDTYFEISNQSN